MDTVSEKVRLGSNAISCSACGFSVPIENHFCGQCGLPIGGVISAEQNEGAGKKPLGRRYVSVVFFDVVSSTQLIRLFDPEQVARIMKLYQSICDQVVSDFGGQVVEVVGDGIVALFAGHENSTESAVRAGDEVIKSIDELRAFESQKENIKLEIRVGISSGEALVKHSPDSKSQTILGQPPYLAARLQSLAEASQVLICNETYSKTRGMFEFFQYPKDQLDLKGFSDVSFVWGVKKPNESQFRFNASNRIKLTPLVGRTELMGSLLSRWELTTQKQGQIAIIKGAAGIGKSRILAELLQRVQRQTPNLISLRYQCSNYAKGAPLYPVMRQFSRAMQIKKTDSAKTITEKLQQLLESWDVNVELFSPILLPLVLDTQRRDLDRGLSSKEIDFAIRACTQLPMRFSRKAPVLVIIEDMHWADDASQRLLEASIKHIESKQLMVAVSYRTKESDIPEHDEHFVSEFLMKGLSSQKAAEMLDAINVGTAPLSASQKQSILHKAEGVPLFLEELTLNAIRSDHSSNSASTLQTPPSLFDLFIQRYDGFKPKTRAVAQLASVIGQEFDIDMISAILSMTDTTIVKIASELEGEEQIYKTDIDSSWYRFKHALIRDAIYDNTLNQDKYRLHKAVYDHLNNIINISSTIAIQRVTHHKNMMDFYSSFA